MSISPFRRGPGMGTPTSDLARELENIPILNGQLVEYETNGTGSAEFVPHGLGRPYRGAFVVGVWSVGLTVQIGTPENTAALGGDPAKVMRIDTNDILGGIIRFWVF